MAFENFSVRHLIIDEEYLIAVDDQSNSVVILDKASNVKILQQKGLDAKNNNMITSMDTQANYVAVGYEDGSLSIHDIVSSTCIHFFKGGKSIDISSIDDDDQTQEYHYSTVTGVKINLTHKYVATCSTDG